MTTTMDGTDWCRCGDIAWVHGHYRPGCALCDCPQYTPKDAK